MEFVRKAYSQSCENAKTDFNRESRLSNDIASMESRLVLLWTIFLFINIHLPLYLLIFMKWNSGSANLHLSFLDVVKEPALVAQVVVAVLRSQTFLGFLRNASFTSVTTIESYRMFIISNSFRACLFKLENHKIIMILLAKGTILPRNRRHLNLNLYYDYFPCGQPEHAEEIILWKIIVVHLIKMMI